ncbi:MAG TPA: cell wall-binding repeat-containing protein [candidate division Zixibacteria bacterium]|nr:cell wall-binding repeat-containing protein [candidate division Zixibacteria bacterium]
MAVALWLAAALLSGTLIPVRAADPTENLPAPPEPPAPGTHGEWLADAPPLPADLTGDPMAESGRAQALESGTSFDTLAVPRLPNGLTREVLGYLPYWELSSADIDALRYDLLSTIAYFGVSARGDGTLARTSGGVPTAGWQGWTSSAMTTVINRAHQRGARVVLTVTMMAWSGEYTAMSQLLNSSANRARLINEIAGVLKARGADGVNLDFEPVPTSLKSQYTTFVREVKAGLAKAGAGSYVTVATMAGAASWATGYDLLGLTAAGAADAIMVMGYDFSWSGSARAGGVAPISNPYILDVGEAMDAHLALGVPRSKVIWGVPYYGRSWPTQNDALNARTCTSTTICPGAKLLSPNGSTSLTYVGARDLAAQKGRRWDATGQVPWTAWYDSANAVWKQLYYDDAASLAAKYDLIRSKDLAGAGIWALGMDTGRTELWGVINAKFLRRDTRLGGADRYATAAAISREGFPSGAKVAYLATGATFPDALAGGVSAALDGGSGGPVLLTRRDELPAATAGELARLKPERVVVLGGTSAISDAVANAAAAHAVNRTPLRLHGSDRYATAAAVSRHAFPNGAQVAVLVTGANFPDALAGGVLAARQGGPVLLVTGTTLPAATAAELDRLNPSRIVVIGGTAAVSDAVLNAAARYATGGSAPERIQGADRWSTAVAVSRKAFPTIPERVFVATGIDFPDALAAVPVAARIGGPLLLVRTEAVPAATDAELYRINPPKVYVLGSTAAVSEQAVIQIHEAFH